MRELNQMSRRGNAQAQNGLSRIPVLPELFYQIYLSDVQDLELARRKISVSYHEGRTAYERGMRSWFEEQTKAAQAGLSPIAAYVIVSVIAAVLGALFTFLGGYDMAGGVFSIGRGSSDPSRIQTGATWWNILLLVAGIACMILAAVFGFACQYRRYQNVLRRKRNIEQHEHRRRELEAAWEEKKSLLKEKRDETDRLLAMAYRLPMLPRPFQELSSVYYLALTLGRGEMSYHTLLQRESEQHEIWKYRERIRAEVMKNEGSLLKKRQREAQNTDQVLQNLALMGSLARRCAPNIAAASAIQELYAQTSNLFSGLHVEYM